MARTGSRLEGHNGSQLPWSDVCFINKLLDLRLRLFCAICLRALTRCCIIAAPLNPLQLFQQVVERNRRQSLYLVTPHEQRSDALDFCTSSFTTQVMQRLLRHLRSFLHCVSVRNALLLEKATKQRQSFWSGQGVA
jgi:hypothetical protein